MPPTAHGRMYRLRKTMMKKPRFLTPSPPISLMPSCPPYPPPLRWPVQLLLTLPSLPKPNPRQNMPLSAAIWQPLFPGKCRFKTIWTMSNATSSSRLCSKPGTTGHKQPSYWASASAPCATAWNAWISTDPAQTNGPTQGRSPFPSVPSNIGAPDDPRRLARRSP